MLVLVRESHERDMWTRRLREFRAQLDAHPVEAPQREWLELPSERGKSFVIAVMDEDVFAKVLRELGRGQGILYSGR